MSSIATFDKVIKRDGSVVEFDINQIAESIYRAAVEVGGRDRDLAILIANEVVYLLNRTVGKDQYPSTEEIQDLIEKTLIERGHARTAKSYILYRAKMQTHALSRVARKAQVSGTIPYEKIWYNFVWNHTYGVETVQKLNDFVRDPPRFHSLTEACNKAYEEDVRAAADKVLAAGDKVRLVIIAGPSSSGKTTTTIKMEERLREEGKALKAINVDNYFFDLELHPKDAYGDYDFETPMAIDINLFNYHLKELVKGKEVLTPFYDFKAGKRIDEQIPLQLAENEIILLDCLHGFYPPLTEGVGPENKFKLYIETLAQQRDSHGQFVRWTDLRLMRRMIRDMQFRGYQPEETLTHWHYVRRSEMQYIIPHINAGDIDHIINGALAYELPIHKFYLGELFPQWVEKYKGQNDRRDAYIRAERVAQLLDEVESATQEEIDNLSKTALMREYIGGSSYKY